MQPDPLAARHFRDFLQRENQKFAVLADRRDHLALDNRLMRQDGEDGDVRHQIDLIQRRHIDHDHATLDREQVDPTLRRAFQNDTRPGD